MKIVSIDKELQRIDFDNGNYIEFFHDKNCCERNYADLEQIEDAALHFRFPEDLIFEEVTPYGFRFGNGKTMFFIPCYSVQSGYYSNEIEMLYFTNKGYCKQIKFHCEII